MSNQGMKDGKKPLSQKGSYISYDEAFGSGTDGIPEHIQKDLDSRGLIPRWLNATALAKSQGRHKRGWEIYRMSDEMRKNHSFGDGDGTVRNGDCILGVKTKEKHALHKEYIEQKRKVANNAVAAATEEFESYGRLNGVKVFKE